MRYLFISSRKGDHIGLGLFASYPVLLYKAVYKAFCISLTVNMFPKERSCLVKGEHAVHVGNIIGDGN